jgi:nucleoside-diphosphate-sugar epimerase
MNVLVIGNLGYVGIPAISLLKKNKIFSIGLDCNWFNLNFYSSNSHSNFPNVQIYDDVRKFKLSKLNYNIDVIIYLAAVSNDPMGKKFKLATKEINYKSCIRIAKEAKKMNVKKFIFASSCSLYGATSDNFPKNEEDKLNPLTDYAVSKALCEKNLKKYSSEKFKVICLRFATAAGYSDNQRLDLVFNDFVASSVCNNKIELLSSGTAWRPLIHVKDMAKAILWAIKYKCKLNFMAINVGSNSWNFKIIDLAKKIGKIVSKKAKIEIKNKAAVDQRSYKVSFDLYESLSGKYKPSINFKKAVLELKLFCEKYKKNLINFRKDKRWSRQFNLDYLISQKKLNHKLMWREYD